MRSAAEPQKIQGQQQSNRKHKVRSRATENTRSAAELQNIQQQGNRKYKVSSSATENTRSAAKENTMSATGQKKI